MTATRDLFRTVLQYCGALVTAVTTAVEALETMADVLVTDKPRRDRRHGSR